MQVSYSGVLVEVATTLHQLELVWAGVMACKPVLLEGAVGTGKTAIVEHLAALTGRAAAPCLTKVGTNGLCLGWFISGSIRYNTQKHHTP